MLTRRPYSERRAAASRANGARSCGPASTRGKTNSSRNSHRHGLRSRDPFAGQDSDETWIELLASHQPALSSCSSETEGRLLILLISCQWRRLQLLKLEKSILEGVLLPAAAWAEIDVSPRLVTRPSLRRHSGTTPPRSKSSIASTHVSHAIYSSLSTSSAILPPRRRAHSEKQK